MSEYINGLEKHKPTCKVCGAIYSQGRYALGILLCLDCGDEVAQSRKFTVVPMHKSNYVAVFSRDDLVGVNQKGGIVK